MPDANDTGWNKHLATAKAWLRDSGVHDWVHCQNQDIGIAPANEHVWKQRIAWLATDGTGALRPERSARGKSAGR